MSKNKLSRRGFIKLSGAALAAGASGGLPGLAQAAPKGVSTGKKAYLPKARGPRVVVVGGGTSGLTIAKYLKIENPGFDVVLVEKRAMYSSCFSSNLWYADVIDLEFLAGHSFLDAAKRGGYVFFNATCTGVDRAGRKVHTDQGEIAYDYLVLAPGIDYDYARIGVNDPDTEYRLRTGYPAGWMTGAEHVSIKRKIENFKGGVFIQTVPGGNFRCKPAPYERTCMIASYFKKHKIKGKVLVLDNNPDIAVKKDGFHAAFNELYKDYVEYVPSVNITGVDADAKTIRTEFDSYDFDEAAIYPGVRASKLIEVAGLVDAKSPQKEARIDVRKYHVPGDSRVYVTGDSRPMGFPKSAHLANSEGKYVAKVIAAHAAGKTIDWTSPASLCYSMVNTAPQEAISMWVSFSYDTTAKAFSPAKESTGTDEKRDAAKGAATLDWAKALYGDLFGEG
ncbi:MAG: NAD(P)/FAD-dependent oxidoreductase [Gammaproteobacteria bacterium]|nr:MAG: NAD(P)/FAD-dependent oxidoreductase [Gammaproteobacteria bacterium]